MRPCNVYSTKDDRAGPDVPATSRARLCRPPVRGAWTARACSTTPATAISPPISRPPVPGAAAAGPARRGPFGLDYLWHCYSVKPGRRPVFLDPV